MHDVQQANKEVQKYPSWVLEVLTMDGYIKKYIQMLAEYGNTIEAWEGVERFYVKWFGTNKYSSYDSFRNCMRNHLKKKANGNK
jgi:hypothetical protein